MDALAGILDCVESMGTWPTQIRLITMPLLPKPKGGVRTIGMMPAVQRLWAKARRCEATEWEDRNQRKYFAAATGNSPVDTVWRQAARQEAQVASGKNAIVILGDLEAFYEGIDRGVLLEAARETGFPEGIMRAAIAAYAGPRVLTMQGTISRAVYLVKGIIVGCSLATTPIKVYMLKVIDDFCRCCRRECASTCLLMTSR